MKKILSLLLTLAVLLTLVSCSSTNNKDEQSDAGKEGEKTAETENQEPVTISFWSHQNPSWNVSYEEVIAKFQEKYPYITVEYENFPYDDFESKVQTSLIEGSGGVDVYEIWGGWAIDFAPNGALEQIPEELAKQVIADTYEPTTGSLLVDGKLYGLPLEFNIESGAMIVNKKLMDQKGLKVPATWEELVQVAKDGTVMDGENFSIKGFDFVNWDSIPYMLMSMILSQGGQYLNEDSSVNFDTPEAKKAFQALADLVMKDKVTDLEGLVGGGELEGYQSLYADRVMMVPRGPWALSEGTDVFGLEYGKDFDYVEMPFFAADKKFAAETGWALAVNAKSEKKEAAMKFLEFFYQDEILLAHNIKATQIPPKKSVAHDPALAEAMPYTKILVPLLENAQFIGHFNTDILKENINLVFQNYVGGEYTDIDAAMQDLNAKLADLAK